MKLYVLVHQEAPGGTSPDGLFESIDGAKSTAEGDGSIGYEWKKIRATGVVFGYSTGDLHPTWMIQEMEVHP